MKYYIIKYKYTCCYFIFRSVCVNKLHPDKKHEEEKATMNRKKRNGKSFLSLLLAVIMTVSLLQMANQATAVHAEEASPEVVQEDAGTVSGQQEDIQAEVSADAAEPSQEETILTENTVTYVPDSGTLPDADELFAGYVEEQFYGDGASPATGSGDGLSVRRSPSMSLFYSGVQAFANYGGSIFTGRALDVYQQLDQKIAEVAANGGDTRFTVTLADPITGATREEAEQLLSTEVNLDTLFDSLLADNPYDLYWYDKTTGTGVSYNIGTGQQATISQIIFEFYVAVEYQEGSNLAVSTSKATAAGNAARTAQGIAAQYVGLSPYAQMSAFKDEICELTDYNHSVVSGAAYGDPWQIIYVFDNDPNTTVVCEGYAKAFQYLCDLNGLTSYTVTGPMGGGTGAGPHMWNIVTLDGQNYLVDVTNSDTGTAGQNGELFLAGTTGSVGGGYTFQAGGLNVSYEYDPEMVALYGNTILTLASSNYTPSQTVPMVTVSATAQNVTYGYDSASAPQLMAAIQNVDGTGATYQWYQVDAQGNATPVSSATAASYTLPTGLGAGTYTYYCQVTVGGQTGVSSRITVTVDKATVTPVLNGTTTKEYDGTTNGPSGLSIGLEGVVTGDAVSASAQSYAYNSADVSTANQITASGITLDTASEVNYQLAATTVSVAGTITRRPVTITPDPGQKKEEGQADPTLTYTVTSGSVVAGETLQGALSRAAGEAVGNYAITQGTLTNDLNPNYDISFTGNVTFEISEYLTYTITFVADGVTVSTVTVRPGESLAPTAFPMIPTKAGYDTISPVWDPGSITNVTSDMTVNAVYFSSQAQEVTLPASASGYGMKLILESGITTVPDSLVGNTALDTPEKLQTALQTAITQTGVSADAANTSLYNVTLMVDEGNGWIIAGPEHFGTNGGLTVTMPYPAGTGMNTHDFTVAHMFTNTDFGKQPGEIEIPVVTKTNAGIQFSVTGLSPIMISWRAAQTTTPTTPGGTPTTPGGTQTTPGNTQTTVAGSTQTATSASGTPTTGDSSDMAMVYAGLLASCAILLGVTVYRKKKAQ